MPVINLSQIADKTRYFQSQDMSAEEAKTEALKQSGFNEALPEGLNTELDKLINHENMTEMSNELGNDKDKLIDRRSTQFNADHEVNPDANPEGQNLEQSAQTATEGEPIE
jgi:hypothetical protein